MGEEYDESQPFLYFTDHVDPAIARATREGRRAEFAGFTAFTGEDIPDPEAERTFLASKLDPLRGDDGHRAWYRELLLLRRDLPPDPPRAEVDEQTGVVVLHRGRRTVVMNFSDYPHEGLEPWSGAVR
jgi:maltooligosyltrehalose trehalohydrolase